MQSPSQDAAKPSPEPDHNLRDNELDGDMLREKCGVFGIYNHPDAAAITALGLHALQHRGQEGAGIVAFDGMRFHSERSLGLVGDTFSRREVIERLPGTAAVGHTRYSTTGENVLRNVQPLFAELNAGGFAVAHNGNLTNGLTLRRELVRNGAMMQSTTDTEVILHLVAHSKRNRFIDRYIEALRAVEGAYALVSLTNKKLVGARDPLGIRPLVLGDLDGSPILASESCALDIIGAKYIRDIEPGEVIVFDEHGVQSHKPFAPSPPRPCIFEYIYFARPDSIVGGRSVYDTRKAMGEQLARETHVEADVIVPVPDSGVPAAIGYSRASGIPFELGIIRNHYVGRTFIQPTQSRDRRQTHRADRRFPRPRHDLEEDRQDDARRRRHRSTLPHRLAADHPSRLLRHRHARPLGPARRHPQPAGNVRADRRRLAGLRVRRWHLPRNGRARPQ
jgi:amidophosphoribosyltransferase